MRIPLAVGRPYARAVFELAKQQGKIEAWSQNLKVLASLTEHPSFLPALRRKKPAEVKAFVAGLGKDLLDKDGLAFANLLVDQKRLPAAARISEVFEQLWLEDRGLGVLKLTTAVELPKDLLADLVKTVEARFKMKLETRHVVDPVIQGGFIAQVGDRVMDSSVRGRLEQLVGILKP